MENNKENEEENIGFNTKCEHFKQKLIDDINSCDIPIAPAYYIIENLYQQMQNTYYGVINDEMAEHPTEVKLAEDS